MAELNVRYATALFDLVIEAKNLKKCLKQSVIVRDALQDFECRNIMEHPHISNADKRMFLQNVFGDGLDENLNGLLQLLIIKNRESLIVPVLTAFIEMGDAHIGNTVADVVSASELSSNQISALKNMLSKKLGKQVEISSRVDPSLIGGFYISVDGYLIDRTIKKQLNEMKNNVKKEGAG